MTHFSLTSLPAIRYASDMPFAVGMVLADEFGNTTEVQSVDGDKAVLAGFHGHPKGTIRVSLRTVRVVYPYLVFVAEMVADAEARAFDDEVARVEALAEAAQYEDDMRAEVLDRAAVEWKRKNADPAIAAYAEGIRVKNMADAAAVAAAEQYEFERDLREDR